MVAKSKEKEYLTFALLDPGSEATIITNHLADKLGLSGKTANVRFGTFRRSEEMETRVVSFSIKSLDTTVKMEVDKAYTVPEIKLSRRNIDWPNIKHRWPHLENLELPVTNSSLVEILIGMDIDVAHVQLGSQKPTDGFEGPRAVLTPFGWIVVGKVSSCLLQGPSRRRSIHFGTSQEVDVSLADTVQQFWSTESFGTNPDVRKVIPEEDARALKKLESSITNLGYRYQVDLLFKKT